MGTEKRSERSKRSPDPGAASPLVGAEKRSCAAIDALLAAAEAETSRGRALVLLAEAEQLLGSVEDFYESEGRANAIMELRERHSGPMIDHPYFIFVCEGYEAWADDPRGALLAARTLIQDCLHYGAGLDASEVIWTGGMLRRAVVITHDGVYDTKLTVAAQAGRLSEEAT